MLKELDVIVGEKGISIAGPVFFIAEISFSHGGSLSEAHRLADAAAECGADAVRVRTSRAGRAKLPDTGRSGSDSEAGLLPFDQTALGWEDLKRLKGHADARQILLIATPDDEESADFLHEVDIVAFQVASCNLTHLPLLRHVASKGRPVLLSTGMSYMGEVAEAVLTLKSAGAKSVVLMHSVVTHPAAPESLNLRAVATLYRHFELPVGYADHSQGTLFALSAAILGATVIEKPLALDSGSAREPCPAAIGPSEMRSLIKSIRMVELSLGDGRKRPSTTEASARSNTRRSIIAAVDIRAHESIARWMLACDRPGTGLEPRRMEQLVGMRSRRDIAKGTLLSWDDLSVSSRLSLHLDEEPAEALLVGRINRSAVSRGQAARRDSGAGSG